MDEIDFNLVGLIQCVLGSKTTIPNSTDVALEIASKVQSYHKATEPAEKMVEKVAIRLHAFVVNQKAVPWEHEIEEIKEDCRKEAIEIIFLVMPELKESVQATILGFKELDDGQFVTLEDLGLKIKGK